MKLVWNSTYFTTNIGLVGKMLFCTYLKNSLSFPINIRYIERGYTTLSDEVIKNIGHQMFERPIANILLKKRCVYHTVI